MITLLCTAMYCALWFVLLHAFLKHREPDQRFYLALMPLALVLHFAAASGQVVVESGYHFDFFPMASAFFAVMNLIVFVSSLRKPSRNLFILLLPATVLAIGMSHFVRSRSGMMLEVSAGMATHILLSVLAYSLLTIATLQALLLTYQTSKLKTHHVRSVMGIFPPLQTMESLLFELLWVGFVLLTLSIVSGALFIEDMFAQQLSHKLVFTLVSWAIYAALLWGRFQLGWRGGRAIRLVLAGFLMLMLAYFGSKFVIEFLLAKP
jgi:ABC-type uncharacterized transport system permease subunit